MDSPFMQKAIPMISVDEKTGKYVLTTQALNFFKAINGPIAVVSVAGLYRTGKSYLLNRVLLNRSNGFGVGPTINPCTKGLWCWGTPIKGTSTDGQPVNIVVIDTEGIGALDEDQTHDTKIFTLAILASSCFIYNSVGSIDQTAIQNLSLVVNLTKHIQLNSEDQSEEGVDPDEISMYFPTFYWVVRDFSLQLQDSEGNQISSKEYLEKALAPQNGFSDDIQQKNRIRRLLTAFFKDRDCFTMIRPLVDQMKLQNLDKMDYDELRPEFVQQAMNFRKRIISSIKAKTLQNQKLNGALYCSMMSSYVAAINDGAVPNIENAWNYMCEEQCRRAMDECYEIFIRNLQENLKDLPKPEDDFNQYVNEAEERALQAYREKALGAQATPGYNELKNRIRTQIGQIRDENIKQSNKNLREYIAKNASIITSKLNSQQYSSYFQYEKEVTAMGEKFIKEGPKLYNYKFIYLQAVRKLSAQGAQFLFKNFTKQQQKTSQMFRQKQKQMSGEIAALKTECELLRKKYNESMSDADQKIFELSIKEQTLRKQLQITIKIKEDEQKKMSRDMQSKMSEQRAKYRALQDKFNELSLTLEDTSRQSTTEQQAWMKQKAVLEQQVKYYLTQIEELQKREKTLDATLNLKQNSMSKQVRQISMRLQTEKQSLKQKLNDQTQRMNEMTEEITALKEELEEKNDKFEKKQKKYKEDLATSKRDMDKMRKDLEHERKQIRQELQSYQESSKEEITSLQTKLKETERSLKEMTDKMRITKSELSTQNSLVSQQNMFIKQQNNSLRSKVEQLKESYESAFKSYQESINESSKQNMDKRIIELQREHKHQKQNMIDTFESEKNRIMCEYNNIKSQYQELEMKFNSMKKQRESNEIQMKAIQEQLKNQISLLINEKNNIENSYKESMSEKQGYYENELRRVEQEFQEYKDKSSEEYERMSEETKNKIEQLRTQSDFQLDNMQRRLQSEREKCEKKIRELTKEHEKQLEEERENYDNINQELSDRLANTEELFRSTTIEYQHNSDMLNKQNTTLVEINRELKENIEKREQEFNMKEMTMTEQYRAEKEKYEAKIEMYVTTNNQKEREIMNLQHEKDQISSLLQRKESRLSEVEVQLAKTQDKLKIQIEKISTKHKELQTELLQKNSSLSLENALLSQKISFEVSRVQQLEQTLTNINKSNEEKYNFFKTEKEEEVRVITMKLTNEKTQIDSKYQQLKATYKDMQMNLKKSLHETFTSKTLLEERIANAEIRLRENQANRSEEVTALRAQLTKTRENISIRDKDNQEIVKSLNQKIEKLQNQKTEATMALEKERVLSEQSRSMLQKISQDYKKEAEQKIQKLEGQLAREHNNRLHDKNNLDSNHNQVLMDLQSRHNQKVQDLSETISRIRFQSQSLMKEKDNQIKELNQKYENERNNKNISVSTLQRKVNELLSNEKKAIDELQKLKKEKSAKEAAILLKEQSEKQSLRRKALEYQNKAKEANAKVVSLRLDFEKQRNKFTFQRETLTQKLTEAQQTCTRIKKQNEKLKSESDKMKTQRKNNTKERSYIGSLKTYVQRSQKSILQIDNKQNASNL